MTVYHGSVCEIRCPDVTRSKPEVDFGPAFYLTSFQKQAERWAFRKGMRMRVPGVVNAYQLDEDWSDWRVMDFHEADEAWLDFVCECRDGGDVWRKYDIIKGRVADDDVFLTIDKYRKGDMTKLEAIAQLRYAKPNDQIAINNPDAIEKLLRFVTSYTVGGRA